MEFPQIIIVFVIVSFISILLFVYFVRSKKVMRDNYVVLDYFSRESRFRSLLRRYGITPMRALSTLIFIGIAIYIRG